jgi:hypothetical protein
MAEAPLAPKTTTAERIVTLINLVPCSVSAIIRCREGFAMPGDYGDQPRRSTAGGSFSRENSRSPFNIPREICLAKLFSKVCGRAIARSPARVRDRTYNRENSARLARGLMLKPHFT